MNSSVKELLDLKIPLVDSAIHICPSSETFFIASTYKVDGSDYLIHTNLFEAPVSELAETDAAEIQKSHSGLEVQAHSKLDDKYKELGVDKQLSDREKDRFTRVEKAFGEVKEALDGKLDTSHIEYKRGIANTRESTAISYLKDLTITSKLKDGEAVSHSIEYKEPSKLTLSPVAKIDIAFKNKTETTVFTLEDGSTREYVTSDTGRFIGIKIAPAPECPGAEVLKIDIGTEGVHPSRLITEYKERAASVSELIAANTKLAGSIKLKLEVAIQR